MVLKQSGWCPQDELPQAFISPTLSLASHIIMICSMTNYANPVFVGCHSPRLVLPPSSESENEIGLSDRWPVSVGDAVTRESWLAAGRLMAVWGHSSLLTSRCPGCSSLAGSSPVVLDRVQSHVSDPLAVLHEKHRERWQLCGDARLPRSLSLAVMFMSLTTCDVSAALYNLVPCFTVSVYKLSNDWLRLLSAH